MPGTHEREPFATILNRHRSLTPTQTRLQAVFPGSSRLVDVRELRKRHSPAPDPTRSGSIIPNRTMEKPVYSLVGAAVSGALYPI
jgi:hypothetical protein